ncbi:hypothetical protein BDF22DRAFT_686195 [Syncephalis plumigaleata]|nr:hypothetical protein BDF22DRAFT_686195 [Syncephalis plumigaleata]
MSSNHRDTFALPAGATQRPAGQLESILKELGAISLDPLIENQEIVNDTITLPDNLSVYSSSNTTQSCWSSEESAPYLEDFPSPPPGYKKHSDALANMLRKRLPDHLSIPSYSHNLVDGQPADTMEPSFPVLTRFNIIFRLIFSNKTRPQEVLSSQPHTNNYTGNSNGNNNNSSNSNRNNSSSGQEGDTRPELCTDLSLANYETELRIGQCTFKVDLTDSTLSPARVRHPDPSREYCAYLAHIILNGFNDQDMMNLVKGDCISALPPKVEEAPLQLSIAIAQQLETSIEFVIESYKHESFAASVHIGYKQIDKVSASSDVSSPNIIDVLKDAATRICHQIDPSITASNQPSSSSSPPSGSRGGLHVPSDMATHYLNTAETASLPSPSPVSPLSSPPAYHEPSRNSNMRSLNSNSNSAFYIDHCAKLEELCQQLGYERPIYDARETIGNMFSCSVTVRHQYRKNSPPIEFSTNERRFLGAKAAMAHCAQLAITRLQSILD